MSADAPVLRLSRYTPYPPSGPQLAFLMLDCRESFYGGAAGGGKSDALLMAALQYVHVPGYRALILRRTFKQLSKGDALIPRSQEWLANTDARWNEERKTWTFPSGATLEFGHVETEAAKYDYQGAAYQFVGLDELTQFEESMLDYIGFSRARRRTSMKELGVPIRTRATGNPGGIGHGWVKRRYIDPATRKPGAVFIPAKVADNPGLDVAEYAASLAHLPVELRQQLLDGDWGVFEGQAYPHFNEQVHVLAVGSEPEAPESWDRFESMDFGSANPTAWYLYAVDYDGNLLVLDELYQPGLVSAHANAIKARRAAWWQLKDREGWPARTNPCFADPSVRNKSGLEKQLGEPASIDTEFADHGIGLTPANNDRRAGHARIAELLRVDPERIAPQWAGHLRDQVGAPRLYVSARCRRLIEQLKSAPLLPIDSGLTGAGEIVDHRWEGQHGHAHAALRYGVMSRPGASQRPDEAQPQKTELELREEHARRFLASIREREQFQYTPI